MQQIFWIFFGTILFSRSYGQDTSTNIYEDDDSENDDGIDLANRILNGKIAEPMTFPYQVSIQLKYAIYTWKFCGGVIIKPKWILTAAHCFDDKIGDGEEYRVRAGVIKYDDAGPTSQLVPIKRMILHPKYDNETFVNDIALLQLKYPLKFNKYVKPIALPPRNYKAKGNGTIVGWGTIDREENNPSPVLRYASLPVSNKSDCDNFFDGPLSKDQLCLGINSTHNACSGDSGGPFIKTIKGKPVVVGITSFGNPYGCFEEDPIVYTDVASHLDFIKETISGKSKKALSDSNSVSHPYLVSLLDYNELDESYDKFCTGVIVHEKWILTAADCFDNENRKRVSFIRMKIGSPSIHKNETVELLEISKFIRHPMYNINDNDQKFNVALVQLKKPLSNSQAKYKTFIPPNYFDVDSFKGQIIGWHIVNSKEDVEDEYKLVTTDVTNGDPEECKKYFPNQSESTICVIRTNEACNFDTSSPLVIPNKNGNFVLGLNAIVGKNCEENKPFLISNILYFSEFIDKIIN